ncbi:MAG: MATE family efflux transporter [Desulfovibrionaceae bacterium]|nr:MATE family efflux transporter [Desulfovibrionaceae bacterium]
MAEHSDETVALGQDPVGSLVLKYSLPAIAGMVAVSLYNVIDSIFIGRGIGDLGIVGVALAFPLMNLGAAVGTLVGIGGASVSSIRLGEGSPEEARNVLGNVTVLNILFGLIFGLLELLVLDDMLSLFGASEETLPYARDFILIQIFGLPVTYTFFNLSHLIRATGYPYRAMSVLLLSVAVNIVLAPLFIFVFKWGMVGAGAATVLSQFCGVLRCVLHFAGSLPVVRFKRGIFRLRQDIFIGIISIGMAPFFVNLCGCAVVAVINSAIKNYSGDLEIGAFGIINRIHFLFLMIVLGLSYGLQPIIGYNFGAKKLDRMFHALKLGLIAGTIIMTFGFILGVFLPRQISGMFTEPGVLLEAAVNGLRLGSLMFPLVGIQIVLANFFQAVGSAYLAMFLSVLRQMGFLVPCLLILPRYFGVDGIWYSLPASDFLATVVVLGLFLLWQKKTLRRS